MSEGADERGPDFPHVNVRRDQLSGVKPVSHDSGESLELVARCKRHGVPVDVR